MDVSCPRCKTEYEFDDARVPETGVTVKCTQCSHVFRVKRKGTGGIAQSIGSGGGEDVLHTKPYGQSKWHQAEGGPPPAPPRSAPPRPSASEEPLLPPAPPPREWKVRNAAGKVFQFAELTTLQKWIIERKVTRDDEISLTGETWKGLGAIAELSSFFQVVEEAQRGRELDALAGQHATLPSMESPLAARPPPVDEDEAALAALPISAPRLRKGAPPLPPPKGGLDPQASPRPFPKLNTPIREIQAPQVRMNAPLRDEREPVRVSPLQERPIDERAVKLQAPPRVQDVEETDEEIATLSGAATGGAGKWLGLLLVALGAFGGGAWYFLSWAPEHARLKAEREQQAWAAKEKEKADAAKVPVDAGLAEVPHDAGAVAVMVAPSIDAGAVVAMAMAMMADAGPPPPVEVDAGVAVAATGGADAGAKAEPVRDYDYYLSQGDRLRDREKPEAALAAYTKAVDMSPDRAEAYAGRGLALLDLGRSEQGEAALQQALKLNRRYGPAIMGLAEAYKGMGENDKALEYYQLYLERLPNGLEANVAKSNVERLKKSP